MKNEKDIPAADMIKLIHEPGSHQVEFEMQHEELKLSWAATSEAK